MAVHLKLEVRGRLVDVRSPDGSIQGTLDNVVCTVPRPLGMPTVVAVGMTLEKMQDLLAPPGDAERVERQLASVNVAPALDLEQFDPVLAAAFVRHVAMDAQRRLKDLVVLDLDLPGFASIPARIRSSFLRSASNVKLRINGRDVWTPTTLGTFAWRAAVVVALTLPILALPLLLRLLPSPADPRLVLAIALAGPLLLAPACAGLRSLLEHRKAQA